MLMKLERVTKSSQKSLDSTVPQSDKLCTNGGYSRPLLHSPGVVDPQRSPKSKVCMIIKDPRVTPLPCWQMFRFIKLLKGEHQTAKLCVAGRGADGCIMVWALLAASRPRCLFITDGTMTSELFQQILKENQDICLRCKSRERK